MQFKGISMNLGVGTVGTTGTLKCPSWKLDLETLGIFFFDV